MSCWHTRDSKRCKGIGLVYSYKNKKKTKTLFYNCSEIYKKFDPPDHEKYLTSMSYWKLSRS